MKKLKGIASTWVTCGFFSPTLFSSLLVPKQLKVAVSLTACPLKSRFLTSRGSPVLPGKGFCFPPCASFPFLLDSFLNTLSSLGLWISLPLSWRLLRCCRLAPPDLGHSHGRFLCGSFLLSSGLCSDITASISTAPRPDSSFLLYSCPLHLWPKVPCILLVYLDLFFFPPH